MNLATRSPWKMVAVSAALLVGFTAVVTSSAAQASEIVYVDQHVTDSSMVTSWEQYSVTEMGQPFIPETSGEAVDMTVWLNDSNPRYFTAAAIYDYPVDGDVSASPLAGGQATISFPDAIDNTVPQPKYAAVMSFPDRPLLEAGHRYLLIITPAVDSGAGTSFVLALVFGGSANTNVMTKESGTWEGYATGTLWYELRMTTPVAAIVVSPQEPQFVAAKSCGNEAVVTTPAQAGVTYATERVGSTVTITATPQNGYEFDAVAVAKWTYDVAAAACPTPPVPPVSPVAPDVPTRGGFAGTVDTSSPTLAHGTLAQTGSSEAPLGTIGLLGLVAGLALVWLKIAAPRLVAIRAQSRGR